MKRDLLLVVGVGSVLFGCAQWSGALAWVVFGGMCLVGFGVRLVGGADGRPH